ncbi:MAG: PTS glucose transporter subunit IIA [Clostridiaceae bacterium]|nr:PTS glucose transporter subunit IIA [Clostridiaceae bacterium]MBW4861126.1 PTS glucose transporter subunit IIA [Clostridiaceae bacterium]MBW4869870.1 PTS glucose transporter subunit IIA [Clostridiaceae bacterium]
MLNFFKKKRTEKIIAPMTGEIVPIESVPDKVFSEKMLGDGVAIDPDEGLVVSPVDGEIVSIFPTNHAVGLKTKDGLEILIHIGLDTVELKGKGFKGFIGQNDKVKKGDLLVEFDIDYVKGEGKSPITPVVITNGDELKDIIKNSGKVEKGEDEILNLIYE